MMYSKSSSTIVASLYAAAITAFIFLHQPFKVESSPYIISDDRVRNLDITPTLGRGYSIMTNSYQSTCLVVDETTIPTYNYDCKFMLDLDLGFLCIVLH